MKIAYLIGNAEPSEQFIEREIRALRELGHEIIVYSVAREDGFVCPWCVLGKHVWLSVLPKTWRAVMRFPFGDLLRLRGQAWREFVGGLDMAAGYAADMRAKGVENVHAHFATKPAAVGAMIAAMTRLPFTMSVHARDVFTEGTALRHKVAAADAVAVCNRAALDALKAKLPARLYGRLVLVRHGIDVSAIINHKSEIINSPLQRRERPSASELEFTRHEPHSPARVLAAGRMVEKKGLAVLIEAMRTLDGCVCEIAGDGPLEPELREQVRRLGIEERVAFSGWLSPERLRERMAESDVLAVPSVVARDGDRDGVPNVLLEAAATGLPIVASDAGGVGEFVIGGETGRLVPPNGPAALASAIRAAFSDREKTYDLAQAARKKVEIEYNLRDNARLLMNLFNRPRRD